MDNKEIIPNQVSNKEVLKESTQQLISDIMKEDNIDEMKKYIKLFNVNQSKKNLLRVVELNDLFDSVTDQAIERFKKRPGDIGHRELLDYMNTVQNALDRAQKTVNSIEETPLIQLTQQNNEVNINLNQNLDRDSRIRVIEVVNKILEAANNSEKIQENTVIEADFEEISDNINENLLNEEGED